MPKTPATTRKAEPPMEEAAFRQHEGVLLSGIGGLYRVRTEDGRVVECRARGALRGRGGRSERVTPLAGDRCLITEHAVGTASLDRVLERRNYLLRPPLANLDVLFIVVSMCDPRPNTLVVDRLISLAEYKGIEPVMLLTKLDAADENGFGDIYRQAGFDVIPIHYEDGAAGETGLDGVREIMRGRLCAFAGNTGVGKSTLLNALCPGLRLETGETSKKLGRGRHTTRATELFPSEGGGLIADTPGFSSFDGAFAEVVYKEDLPRTFREFAPYVDECRFTGCSHTCEKGCAVLEAVRAGKIAPSRHESYLLLYREVRDIHDWEKKKT